VPLGLAYALQLLKQDANVCSYVCSYVFPCLGLAYALQLLKQDANVCSYVCSYVFPCLGLSYALQLLKQEAKARNHLKRISKMQYNSEEAEEMEQSYLLLAQSYISQNKNDLAQELCRKCLTHNKSCAKVLLMCC
jgi:cell division FtsZ-interacting protein ZapD